MVRIWPSREVSGRTKVWEFFLFLPLFFFFYFDSFFTLSEPFVPIFFPITFSLYFSICGRMARKGGWVQKSAASSSYLLC